MKSQASFSSDESQVDFAALLEQSCEDIGEVRRGDLLTGTILAIDEQGIIIDVGLKRDGVVQRSDIEALGDDHPYHVGQTVMVMVVEPEDRDGNLLVSIQQARASKDWEAARQQMEREEPYIGEVIAANRGGLIVLYGELRGFVPASHVVDLPRGLDDEARAAYLARLIGQSLTLKIIEVNPRRRRLVFSQIKAQREARDQVKDRLLETLKEGDIVQGRVSSLRDFGAFIDLGGADGLVHVSELAWRRVHHPSEILSVGMEVKAYVLQLDREGKRIGLSLKRLQPNPWAEIEEKHQLGDLVEGTVSRVVSFGAFVELENGVEALLHISQMGNPPPQRPEDVVQPGQHIVARIISLEPQRQRIGLSLKGLIEAGEGSAHMPDDFDTPEVSGEGEIDEPLVEADAL